MKTQQSDFSSLNYNTNGYKNTAVGFLSLNSNTTGSENTALGLASLQYNTIGEKNTALGLSSLRFNTTGEQNTALGGSSLYYNTTGSNNIAIGYNAQVLDGAASNQVRIGNEYITYAAVQVPWTITSDRRLKSDIQNSNLALNFINELRPVSYYRNNDEKHRTEYGFIAQEVEEALKESGVENTGMITIDDKGMYQLRYNDLLAPMVKAIQELKVENEKLKRSIRRCKNQLRNNYQKLKILKEEFNKQIKLLKINNKDEDAKFSSS